MGSQLDFGMMGKTDFENNSFEKKNYSPHVGAAILLNYRVFDALNLELGFGQNRSNTRLKNPAFEKQNEGFSMKMNLKNYYWNYYAAVSGAVRLGLTKSYVYGKMAYSINVYGGESISNQKSFAITRLAIDQSISSKVNYVDQSTSIIPEIGYQHKQSNGNLIAVGLKMNLSDGDILNGIYEVQDNIRGIKSSEAFSSLGNFTALTFQYNLRLHHIAKKERVKRIKEKPIEEDIEEETVNNDEIVGVEPPKDTTKSQPKEIANRRLVVSNKLKVNNARVTVFIWDHQTVDGDRVSLNLNGEWILVNYTLEKEKHSFEIDLEEGSNIFVLHALNLGKYSPNTAALIIKDGIESHRIILESDMKESGTLEINYKKK